MIVLDSIGWWNTGMPLLVLGGLAIVLPRLMIDRQTRSHLNVARGMLGVAVLLLLIGVVLSMVVTAARGFDALGNLWEDPMTSLWMHSRLSLLGGIVWGPLLALVWFAQAQAVEARRGQDLVLQDRGTGDVS